MIKGKTIILIVLFMLIVVSNLLAQVEPYLSTPTSSSIWVSWKTTTETESIVEFGLIPENLEKIATGTYESLADNYKWHTVKLTGLTPDTRYYYRTNSNGQVSKIHSFRSQPLEGTDSGHYRFAIIGDHQVLNDNRYERLVQACKDKVIEKYATSASDTLIEDHLRLLVCDGDQVNVGTLEEYEKMHFGQSRPLMSNVPIMTVLGNHEYGGDPDLKNYFGHYVYHDISYNGISGSRGEEYYAFNVANILFVMINSNLYADLDQYNWIEQIMREADTDTSVEWVFATNHHCFYNEQMPGDGIISVRNGYGPRLAQTDKYVMHITGHAHLYARGSLRNHPCHVIVNGGASWDQYWGQTVSIEYPDVQKTIERQIFQIVDIDLDKREMYVETYSNGTNLDPGFTEDKLIDEFYIKLDATKPNKPSFTNSISEPIVLPFTFSGSEYSGQEPLNSVEFQVAGENKNFAISEYSLKTDYENLYLSSGAPDYIPIDLNAGKDITKLELDSVNVLSGVKYLRMRYRDKSLHWSDWSDTISFTVLNGRPVPDPCPVLRYKLEGNANEFLGSGLDGTSSSGVTFVSDIGIGNEVAEFDNNSIITISLGDTENIQLPVDAISVSCWVKLNSTDTWGGFVGLLQDNGSYEKGWLLGTRDNNFSFALSTGGSLNYLLDSGTFNLGEWYHVIGTYDGITQRLYVNGVLKASEAMMGEISYPPTGWFQIGSYKDDDENFGHDGKLSDIIIWQRAITLKDARNIFNNSIPPCVEFIADKTEIASKNSVQFSENCQFDPQSLTWYFEGGNPQTSYSQNPVVIYNEMGNFDVLLYAENSNGVDSLIKRKYINVGSVGIDLFNEKEEIVRIYPNPAENYLNIEIQDMDFAGSLFTIQNSNGSTIYSGNFSLVSSVQTLNINKFPGGVYSIRIVNKRNKTVTKIFIVK